MDNCEIAKERRYERTGKTTEELIDMAESEETPNYVDFGSMKLLDYIEFSFSLGVGPDGKYNLSGNMLDKECFSNAFSCTSELFDTLFGIVSKWDKWLHEYRDKIKTQMDKHPNDLFLVKARNTDGEHEEGKIYWHFFPYEVLSHDTLEFEWGLKLK